MYSCPDIWGDAAITVSICEVLLEVSSPGFLSVVRQTRDGGLRASQRGRRLTASCSLAHEDGLIRTLSMTRSSTPWDSRSWELGPRDGE